MKKMNNTQILLLIITLIAGAAYLLYNPKGPGFSSFPGMPISSDYKKSNTDLEQQTKPQEPLNINDETNDSVKKNNNQSLIIQNWRTTKNIPVFFVPAPELPMIDINVSFKAGSAYGPEKPGIAALTNEMLAEGTKKYNTEQISEQFESIGAEYSAGTSKDSAELGLRSLTDPDKLNLALEVFMDIIQNPSFPSKSFNRLQKQTIESLKLEQQYPENIVSKTFYKEIYNKHPYAIPTNGTIESVEKLTKKDLEDFYNKFYVNNNAQITIVGAVDKKQAEEIANQISAGITNGDGVDILPEVPTSSYLMKQHVDFPSTQTHIIIGSIGIKRSDPDYFPLMVGNHVLGRMPLTSLLFKNIRVDRGLAYSVYSSFVPMLDAGPFFINMQTRNEKSKEALDVTLDTLNNYIENGPSDNELQLAKDNLIGSFPLTIASNSKKIGVVSSIGFYNLPLDYLDTYIDNVNKVTKQDIITAFKKHIDLKNIAIVTVGDVDDKNASPVSGAKDA